MCRWIETIALVNGVIINLDYHIKRIERSLVESDLIVKSLIQHLDSMDLPSEGQYKLRVLYDSREVVEVALSRYSVGIITSFELVEAVNLDYSAKYEDRSLFNQLKEGSSFDELIITQNGFITDTTYSNLIFQKQGNWFTPHTFLLRGTYRESLLDKGEIKEANITHSNLASFSKFKLINAMLPIETSPTYLIDQIHCSTRSFLPSF